MVNCLCEPSGSCTSKRRPASTWVTVWVDSTIFSPLLSVIRQTISIGANVSSSDASIETVLSVGTLRAASLGSGTRISISETVLYLYLAAPLPPVWTSTLANPTCSSPAKILYHDSRTTGSRTFSCAAAGAGTSAAGLPPSLPGPPRSCACARTSANPPITTDAPIGSTIRRIPPPCGSPQSSNDG